MEWLEIAKAYGPQGIPWIALGYLGKWVLDRAERDMESRFTMALAIQAVTEIIKELRADIGGRRGRTD